MTSTPYHNKSSFARAVERLIGRADLEGRGDDLDRVVSHVSTKPREVTSLTSLMLMLDEDYRLSLTNEVQAFRRWGKQKGLSLSDDEIFGVMMNVYEQRRSG